MEFGLSKIIAKFVKIIVFVSFVLYLFSSGENQKEYLDFSKFIYTNSPTTTNLFPSNCSDERKIKTASDISKKFTVVAEQCPSKIYLSVTVDVLDEAIQSANTLTKAGKVINLFSEKEEMNACKEALNFIVNECPSLVRRQIKSE